MVSEHQRQQQQQNIHQINGVVSSSSSLSTNKVDHQQQQSTIEYMEVDDNNLQSSTVATTTFEEQEMSDTMPSSSTNKQQQYTIKDVPTLMKRLLKPNEYWYILDKRWYDSFLEFINDDNDDEKIHPGKIDNKELLRPANNVMITKNKQISSTTQPITYRLKTTTRENEDFVIVPEEVWNLLVKEFGIVDGMGGYPIRCPIIERTESYYQVELNPLELRLTLYGSKDDMVKQYSRNCRLRDVIDDMRKLFNIDKTKPIQLWNNATLLLSYTDDNNNNNNCNNNNNSTNNKNVVPSNSGGNVGNAPPPPPPPPPQPSSSSSSSGSKALISDINQRLLDIVELEAPNTVLTIEQENPDHTWPSSKTKLLGAITRSKYASGVPNSTPGVCGLMNLGNTCFMNTAIQCLSNTAPLTKFFLSDQYLNDINPDNPLGMRGEIAKRYAELIKTIWSGFHSSVAPREFKIAVTQFAPQFSGFAHHDCQELMAFLLDGLHEDLNRVKVKPYIEMKNDIEKRSDEIVSKESWINYKRRNDSIIVDTFHAQLKSTLVCPECELVSVTFDPFCYLTLPLPYRIEKPVDILFIPAISKRPICRKNISATATSTSNRQNTQGWHNNNSNNTTTSITTAVRSILLENVMIPKTGCANDIRLAVAKYLNDFNNNLNKLIQNNQQQQQNENNNTSNNNENRKYFNRKFDSKKMIVANIMDCRMNKIYQSTDYYNPHVDDIVVYELDDPLLTNTSNLTTTTTTQSLRNNQQKLNSNNNLSLPVFIRQINADHSHSIISRPFFINLKTVTYENIHNAIFKELISLVINVDKVNDFLQSMEEVFIEEIDDDQNDDDDDELNKQENNKMKKNQRIRRSSAGSDDEDNDDDVDDDDDNDELSDDNLINNNNNLNNDSNDEGVDEIYGNNNNNNNRNKKNKNKKKTKSINAYTIITCNNNAQCQLSIIKPGVRLDLSSDDCLAINIHYRIVLKYFPPNLNRHGLLRLSELLQQQLSMINNNNLYGQQQINSITPSPSSLLTLNECINQFTLVEKLGENDPWYCPRCKKHQMASKKFDIWSLPNNLIIHLKRFSYSRLHRDKLNVLVEFPIENLDMTKYVLYNPQNEKFIYDLIAVSNHYGELGAGHYTAYGKNFQTQNWFLFDDNSVTPIGDKNKVMTKAAYVLFYQRKQQQQQNDHQENNL